ncbi:MAG: hypothetical protein ACRYGF_18145 [Janthinobacterium lividum]
MTSKLFVSMESFGYGVVHIEVNGETWTNTFFSYEAAVEALEGLGCLDSAQLTVVRSFVKLVPEGHSLQIYRPLDTAALTNAGFYKTDL